MWGSRFLFPIHRQSYQTNDYRNCLGPGHRGVCPRSYALSLVQGLKGLFASMKTILASLAMFARRLWRTLLGLPVWREDAPRVGATGGGALLRAAPGVRGIGARGAHRLGSVPPQVEATRQIGDCTGEVARSQERSTKKRALRPLVLREREGLDRVEQSDGASCVALVKVGVEAFKKRVIVAGEFFGDKVSFVDIAGVHPVPGGSKAEHKLESFPVVCDFHRTLPRYQTCQGGACARSGMHVGSTVGGLGASAYRVRRWNDLGASDIVRDSAYGNQKRMEMIRRGAGACCHLEVDAQRSTGETLSPGNSACGERFLKASATTVEGCTAPSGWSTLSKSVARSTEGGKARLCVVRRVIRNLAVALALALPCARAADTWVVKHTFSQSFAGAVGTVYIEENTTSAYLPGYVETRARWTHTPVTSGYGDVIGLFICFGTTNTSWAGATLVNSQAQLLHTGGTNTGGTSAAQLTQVGTDNYYLHAFQATYAQRAAGETQPPNVPFTYSGAGSSEWYKVGTTQVQNQLSWEIPGNISANPLAWMVTKNTTGAVMGYMYQDMGEQGGYITITVPQGEGYGDYTLKYWVPNALLAGGGEWAVVNPGTTVSGGVVTVPAAGKETVITATTATPTAGDVVPAGTTVTAGNSVAVPNPTQVPTTSVSTTPGTGGTVWLNSPSGGGVTDAVFKEGIDKMVTQQVATNAQLAILTEGKADWQSNGTSDFQGGRSTGKQNEAKTAVNAQIAGGGVSAGPASANDAGIWDITIGGVAVNIFPTGVVKTGLNIARLIIQVIFIYAWLVWTQGEIRQALVAAGHAPQARGNTFAGSGGQLTAGVAAGLLTTIILGIPVAMAALTDNGIGWKQTVDFFSWSSSGGSVGAGAFQIFFEAFPVLTFTAIVNNIIVWKVGGTVIIAGAMVAAKWIVPMFAAFLALQASDVEAAIVWRNQSAQDVYVSQVSGAGNFTVTANSTASQDPLGGSAYRVTGVTDGVTRVMEAVDLAEVCIAPDNAVVVVHPTTAWMTYLWRGFVLGCLWNLGGLTVRWLTKLGGGESAT